MKIGDKIKFKSEVQRYTVRARNERYVIATKPFNAKKTFLYTIIDIKDNIRGADNYYCMYDYHNNLEECKKALEELNKGTLNISSKNVIDLDIEKIEVVQ